MASPAQFNQKYYVEEPIEEMLAATAVEVALSQVVGLPAPREELLDDHNFDVENPRSMINLLPKVLRDYAVLVPQEFFEMTEDQLKLACFDTGVAFDEARRLRLSFWDEYDRAARYDSGKMDMKNITGGICAHMYFLKKYVTNQKWLAWMLTPPTGYIAALTDIHEISLRQMLAIVQLPLERDDKGRWDVKLMNLQKSIYERADARLKGAIAQVQQISQTVDQRNVNVNIAATPSQAKGMLGPNTGPSSLSFEEVESRIRLLEKKSVSLQAPSHIETDLMRDISPVRPEVIVVEADEEVEP